jgi:hypothetical protein
MNNCQALIDASSEVSRTQGRSVTVWGTATFHLKLVAIASPRRCGCAHADRRKEQVEGF